MSGEQKQREREWEKSLHVSRVTVAKPPSPKKKQGVGNILQIRPVSPPKKAKSPGKRDVQLPPRPEASIPIQPRVRQLDLT